MMFKSGYGRREIDKTFDDVLLSEIRESLRGIEKQLQDKIDHDQGARYAPQVLDIIETARMEITMVITDARYDN